MAEETKPIGGGRQTRSDSVTSGSDDLFQSKYPPFSPTLIARQHFSKSVYSKWLSACCSGFVRRGLVIEGRCLHSKASLF